MLLRTRESLPLLLLGRTDASNSRQKSGGGTGNQATHRAPPTEVFWAPPMDGRLGSRYVYKQGCQIKIPVWGRTNNSAAYVRVLIDKGVF